MPEKQATTKPKKQASTEKQPNKDENQPAKAKKQPTTKPKKQPPAKAKKQPTTMPEKQATTKPKKQASTKNTKNKKQATTKPEKPAKTVASAPAVARATKVKKPPCRSRDSNDIVNDAVAEMVAAEEAAFNAANFRPFFVAAPMEAQMQDEQSRDEKWQDDKIQVEVRRDTSDNEGTLSPVVESPLPHVATEYGGESRSSATLTSFIQSTATSAWSSLLRFFGSRGHLETQGTTVNEELGTTSEQPCHPLSNTRVQQPIAGIEQNDGSSEQPCHPLSNTREQQPIAGIEQNDGSSQDRSALIIRTLSRHAKLDNIEGPVNGCHTDPSVLKIIDTLRSLGIGENDIFADLGSNHNKIPALVATELGCSAVGFEVVAMRVFAGAAAAAEYLSNPLFDANHRIGFVLEDLMNLASFGNITVLYANDEGFPPYLIQRISCLMTMNPAIRLAIFFKMSKRHLLKKTLEDLGWQVALQINVRKSVSGEGNTVYFYRPSGKFCLDSSSPMFSLYQGLREEEKAKRGEVTRIVNERIGINATRNDMVKKYEDLRDQASR